MNAQTDYLAIWNQLGRTDPDQTKPFTRGGGFRGTAIKPIYQVQKMTAIFGPCGIGWGYSEPQYQVVHAGEHVLVYCWLTLWYVKDGKRSHPVPGVGGDFAAKHVKDRIQYDDEAFKKAMTDALGNAMTKIGMAADVHMGRFDDSKYVESLREEKEAARSARKSSAQAKRDEAWPGFEDDLRQCESVVAVEMLRADYRRNIFPEWPEAWVSQAEEAIEKRAAELTAEDLPGTLADSLAQEEWPETKAGFIQRCHERIDAFSESVPLLEWWNSTSEKAARRRYSLTKDEAADLMARVTAKRARIVDAPHGRDTSGRALHPVEAL